MSHPATPSTTSTGKLLFGAPRSLFLPSLLAFFLLGSLLPLTGSRPAATPEPVTHSLRDLGLSRLSWPQGALRLHWRASEDLEPGTRFEVQLARQDSAFRAPFALPQYATPGSAYSFHFLPPTPGRAQVRLRLISPEGVISYSPTLRAPR